MMLSRQESNELGGVTALLALALTDAIFLARLTDNPAVERGLGLIFLGMCVPIGSLLLAALQQRRQTIYVVWLALFAGFLLVEGLLGILLEVPVREVGWQAAPYIALLLGGLGGMVGLAGHAGKRWRTVAVVGFASAVGLLVTHYGVIAL